ncbi:MAG: FAD:protein FMN transferase [Microbacteriaceae bacterium]|nr:FAD:protein FMN transferase [Microbacteriaceae bacterium]
MAQSKIPHTSIAASAIRAAQGDGGAPTVTRQFSVMGTVANLVVVGGTEDLLDELERTAFHLQSLWSRFVGDSDITRLNNAEGAPVTVNPLTSKLVTEMLAARMVTDGEYDPTILPKLVAEGYAVSRVDPSQATTLPASARWPIDPTGTVIEGNVVTLPLGVTLDSGGIGKGIAADILTTMAIERGALGALVEMGGDVRIGGTPPDGTHWRIGIEDPYVEARSIARVNLVDGAVATSSTLKRVWDKNGKSVNHLIDVHTGESMTTNVVTVSVIAVSAGIAEVITKAGFTRRDFLEWAPTLGAAAFVVYRDGTTAQSVNWKDYS